MMNSTSSSNFSMNAVLLETDSDTGPCNDCLPIYVLVGSFLLSSLGVILYLWVI